MPRYAAIGPNTGYIATASEGLVIGYSRNPTSYRLAQYCAQKPVRRTRGYYQRFNPAVQARLGKFPANDARWARGADRPNGLKNQEEFEFVGYLTERYDEPVNSERTAMEQADWAVADHNARNIANLAMLRRTWLVERALNLMLTKVPVDSGQAGSILPGIFGAGTTGNFTGSSTDRPVMLGVLNYAAQKINKATYSVMQPHDLCIKVNPTTAGAMALQPEVQSAFAQSPYARGLITGDDTSADSPIAAYNARWGLPAVFRGYPVVVEDAIWDSGLPGDDPNPQYVMPDNCLDVLATPGGKYNRYLEADVEEGAEEKYFPVSWTVAELIYQDFEAETFEDDRNRRSDSHISYDLQPQVTSPLSGLRLTNLFS